MTQEDKELLLKDLCARLSYEVKVSIPELQRDQIFTLVGVTQTYIVVKKSNMCKFDVPINLDFKLYLRPMSSMTEEERKEYNDIVKNTIDFYDCPKSEEICFFIIPIDWLNARHFDYRGLIEKGLAIEVTEENNPYEN